MFSADRVLQILYTADTADAPIWPRISAPITRTGFETEIDISAASHSTLVRAKAVNRDGAKLGWTDAADGSGNYFQASDPDDSKVNISDAASSATDISTSTTAIDTMSPTSTASVLSSSTHTAAASNITIPPSLVLKILAIGVAFAGFPSI